MCRAWTVPSAAVRGVHPMLAAGEGRVWAKAPKTSSAVLGGDSVGDVDEEADSDVGESADANDL